MQTIQEQVKHKTYSLAEFKHLAGNLLSRCDNEDIDILLESFTLNTGLKSGDILIKQGEYSDCLYLIVSGILSVEIESSIETITLGMMSKGQWVGDVSLIDPGPASSTVKILEDAVLLQLKQSLFIKLRECHPRTASRFINALSLELAERLRVSSTYSMVNSADPLLDTSHEEVPHKLNKFIFELGRWLTGIQNDEIDHFLKNQVASYQKELSQKFKHLYQRERDDLLINERKRILAELHDGVGGQLVAMLSMMENRPVTQDELKDVVRNALDDLRLMIDSLDEVEGDIPVVLGMFRTRLERRLSAQNIAIEWKVTDLPILHNLGPHEVLQILRVLQEAITNIIKHSSANTISLATDHYENAEGDRFISIAISDNGRGFNLEDNPSGHGMTTMRERITKIGGKLSIDTGSLGTTVTLILPVLE